MSRAKEPSLDSDSSEAPALAEHEQKKAEEEESLNANVTYEVIRREGVQELERSSSALAWSGLAAGLSMGFSFLATGVLHSHLPDAAWRPLVTSAGYTVGFLIVILASQQLFTENTLKAIVPLLAHPGVKMLGNVARLWAVVLLANLVGGLLFAWVLNGTELVSPEVRRSLLETGRKAVEHGFWTSVVKAIFAGWLVALMVWMLPAAQTAHVAVIVVMSYLIALAEFLHIIAGASEVFYLAFSGELAWGATVTRFLAPVLLGNVIGGVTLVSALNHAQVVSGEAGGESG
jgi:formate-nitrite transporter family protein